MSNVPSGTELARPFVPAKDLELAKRFYVKLGFEKVLDGDVVVFRVGSSGFILSSFDQAVPAPSAPALQPWGLRIAYLVDPSGVLWHVAQRRPGKPQDV